VTVRAYLWTQTGSGGYAATLVGTMSVRGAAWTTYSIDLATPQALVRGQTYAIGFVCNDTAWIPWNASSSSTPTDTVWGTGLGYGYGSAATSGSRDLPAGTRTYAQAGPSFSVSVELPDLDGDGFDVLDDCDDASATTYPGAPDSRSSRPPRSQRARAGVTAG
jgi:hypothetical protein